MEQKKCKTCCLIFDIDNFYKGHGKCKTCYKEMRMQWYKENKQQALENNRQWRRKNPLKATVINRKATKKFNSNVYRHRTKKFLERIGINMTDVNQEVINILIQYHKTREAYYGIRNALNK